MEYVYLACTACYSLKTFGQSGNKKWTKETSNCCAAEPWYWEGKGTHLAFQTTAAACLQSQRVWNIVKGRSEAVGNSQTIKQITSLTFNISFLVFALFTVKYSFICIMGFFWGFFFYIHNSQQLMYTLMNMGNHAQQKNHEQHL